MFPMSQEQNGEDPSGVRLEDRLRGLILSNAYANPAPNGQPQIPIANGPRPTPAPAPAATTPNLPPHMLSATPAQQQEYLRRAMQSSASQTSADAANRSPQGGRKRLNQAQRRQMSSQLSIPVAPSPNQPSPSSRGYTPYSAHGQHSYSPQFYNGNSQPQNNQRFRQNQQYSPRFTQQSPASPFSPQMHYQNSPSSSGPQFSPNSQFQRQGSSPQQQYHPANQGNLSAGFYNQRPVPQNAQLYQPGPYNNPGRGRAFTHNSEEVAIQSAYLEKLSQERVPQVGVDDEEVRGKEAFRATIEKICQEAISEYEKEELANQQFNISTVQLKCFGSMSTGFATKASDMDLALLTPQSVPSPEAPESRIPRILENELLSMGYGARLLTRTRVPIIKLCEKPTEKLLTDLLAERKKWEDGFIVEGEDGDEEATLASGHGKDTRSTAVESEGPVDAAKGAEIQSKKDNAKEEKPTEKPLLQQKEHQSLGDYYNCAKRVLRKLGSRDLSLNSPELTKEEAKILNEVCRAFISGLYDQELATRLSHYTSISPLYDPSLPFVQKSLSGVFIQIEGERLAMGWDHRIIKEVNDNREAECLAFVEAWRTLQDKTAPLTESNLYNRQLYAASERLKRINSLQLFFLEQLQYEEPGQYYARVRRILNDLKSYDQHEEDLALTVIPRYITGIHNQQIREKLQEASRSVNALKTVALQHQILQLVHDYEHAIEVEVYDESDRLHIEQYICILRSQVTNSPAAIDPDLLAKIRSLPDPTQVSLNKPRDRYRDHLEFPKTGVGIQCDINFSAHLALHNTLLLRLYSLCDPRVRTMVLFVKHWAKIRGINTPYRGSLSSYGYVLMVLHYLVNIAQPFVCPNLQLIRKDAPPYLSPSEIEAQTVCNGRDVRFWRNEAEIKDLAERKMLNHNHDSIGLLLRGFFEYFAQGGQMTTVNDRGFDWGREVLSLRTQGGILTKQEKGWVGARTVVETTTTTAPPTPLTPLQQTPITTSTVSSDTPTSTSPKTPKPAIRTIEEVKEIRHRYLFAIEDPFELDHNVARTVTHNGIVSIRDEFRRAWGILRAVGRGSEREGLLDEVATGNGGDTKAGLNKLLDLIHGSAGENGN